MSFHQTVYAMAALRYDSYVFQMYYAPISEDIERRLPQPLQPNRPLDLDIIVPPPVARPDEPWVDFVNTAKDEFEVDGASAVRYKSQNRLAATKLHWMLV